jgi:hypothetical protein
MRLNRTASPPPPDASTSTTGPSATKPAVVTQVHTGGEQAPALVQAKPGDTFAGTTSEKVTVQAPVARSERLSPIQTRLAPASATPEQALGTFADEVTGTIKVRRAPPLSPAQQMTAFQGLLDKAMATGPLSAESLGKASDALVALIHTGPRPDSANWASWLTALPPVVEKLLLADNANRHVLYNASILWDYMPRADFKQQKEMTAALRDTKFARDTDD